MILTAISNIVLFLVVLLLFSLHLLSLLLWVVIILAENKTFFKINKNHKNENDAEKKRKKRNSNKDKETKYYLTTTQQTISFLLFPIPLMPSSAPHLPLDLVSVFPVPALFISLPLRFIATRVQTNCIKKTGTPHLT